MKRFASVHILAALFLLLGMGVQSYVSYSRARFRLQENMELEMQIAQEKLLFELYDALEAWAELEDGVKKQLSKPRTITHKTEEILNRYPTFYACYVAFPPYYFPQEKWFEPTTYRTQDTIIYWSTPYRDDDFDEPIYTYSKVMRDEEGKLICVIGIDFSLKWINQLLDQFKPFDAAVFMLYSSNGTLLAASDGAPKEGFDQSWIISRKTLLPININMVTAIPKSHILKSLRLGILLPLSVFVLGILVVGLLIRRITRDEQVNARLETEKKVLSHELEIAHDIQMGILKDENEKKQAQGNGDIELQTLLVPMREVGGDLFDFHREGDELWFIIGDVSGKGVPAAIFMSAAVNLFRAAGVRATSPKEIMEEMNAILSENNPSLTFVTAFIGCLHIPTGELLFCNAGHCAPLIKHKLSAVNQHSAVSIQPSEVRCLQIEPNIPLGYDGRYCFVEQGCMLGEGDTLVLYTDGVTEAHNSEREMLGLKRWSDIVAKNEDLPNAIKHFIGQADPTDDITLMTICKKSPVLPMTINVPCREDQWPVLRNAIHSFGLCIGMERKALKKYEVAAEEAIVNILHYSQANDIEIVLSSQDSAFTIQLMDDGLPFDPTEHTPNNKTIDERQIGGMGIHLIRQIVDEMHYERKKEKNILRMVKLLNR